MSTESDTPAGVEALEPLWFLIAVRAPNRRGDRDVVILDHAPGWAEFNIEFYWEDTFQIDAPDHLEPGAYLWTGYKVGYWGEDDHINVSGGEFTPYARTLSTRITELEADKARLIKASRYILPYLHWTISDESPGHHPTMPSAVGAFEEALSTLSTGGNNGE